MTDTTNNILQPKHVLKHLNLDINKQRLYTLEKDGELGAVKQVAYGKKSTRVYDYNQIGIIAQKFGHMPKATGLVVMAVAQGKGGVAKSTQAFIMARQAAMHGNKVIVIGLDEQETISELIHENELNSMEDLKTYDARKGLYHHLYDNTSLDDIIVQSQEIPNLYLIEETPELEDLNNNILLKEDYKLEVFKNKLIPKLKKRGFDIIIFDCPPSISSQLTKNALVASNNVLMPIACEIASFKGFNKALKKFLTFQQEAEARGLINWDNIFHIPTKVKISARGKSLSMEIHNALKGQFRDTLTTNFTKNVDLFEKSINDKKTPIEIKPNDADAKNMFELNCEIWRKILHAQEIKPEIQ